MSTTLTKIQETRRELERLEQLAEIERDDPFTALIIRAGLSLGNGESTARIRIGSMHATCIACHIEGLWTSSAERAMDFLITYHASTFHEQAMREILNLPKRKDEAQSNERA